MFQCGVRTFFPWLLAAEERVERGLEAPADLVSACSLLGDVKTFQDDCLLRVTVLDNAKSSASKMTYHDYAEHNIEQYRGRWVISSHIS